VAEKERGITQRKFSLLVDDHDSVVSRIVNGVWNPDPERRKKYAEALGMKGAELFGDARRR
jgi:transcriptional regulator with XRE-family HTH domain